MAHADTLTKVIRRPCTSRRWGALAPQRKTRRFTGDREFGALRQRLAVEHRCLAIGFAIGSVVGAATAPRNNPK